MVLPAHTVKTNPHGRERADHGSALFPIACYGVSLDQGPVPSHWHDELEVGLVAQGTAVISVEGVTLTLHAGDGFFISPDGPHSVDNGGASPCRLRTIVFHPRLVGTGMDSLTWLRYTQPVLKNRALQLLRFDHSTPWHRDAISAIQSAWDACAAEKPGYEFAARDALNQLMRCVSAHHAQPPEGALEDEARMAKMLSYIYAHYAQDMTVAAIAASASIGVGECLRCFRQMTGIAPTLFVMQFRVQKAARLLSSTAQNAADIGRLCGFSDASYFIKIFRQLMGVTPGQYRKQAKNQPG